MHLLRPRLWLTMVVLLSLTGRVAAQGNFGQEAPDFPPGLFNDGSEYRLADLKGKVIVLWMYESTCPRCRGMIPEQNKIVQALKDRPVKFIAIGASDTAMDVANYGRQTGLAMPIFVDSLGLMEKRYGQKISLNNILQVRVIGVDGKVAGLRMDANEITKAAEKATWKYKGDDYDARLNPALDCFEWGQYSKGAKLLAPLRKNKVKAVADSADKLFNALKEEGKEWKEDADKLAEDEPVQAHDLYTRIAVVFAGDELGKAVDEPLKKLQSKKAVKDEIAARKAYALALSNMSRMTPAQKRQAAALFQSIAKKFADTPTGDKAAEVAKELAE
jgi:thiol-disulfide isomerase/thioredoxin